MFAYGWVSVVTETSESDELFPVLFMTSSSDKLLIICVDLIIGRTLVEELLSSSECDEFEVRLAKTRVDAGVRTN